MSRQDQRPPGITMYQYDHYDRSLLAERVAQYRSQVSRYLAGTLSEEAFLPLRLQNGVYNQRYSHMLRVAIPYGMLSAPQMRALADVGERWDKGWGHFTTRQNVQFNWCGWKIRRISWPFWPNTICMPSRPPAIASAIS